ncbi:hypothetical protein [Marixanthomonas ophiurae]|uniref:Uncharacterized protein n=1 Tax=Marixanthomonas ophiurae TaxID=387659 RepID=A0A3E1Q8T6_9FLAO|nr:hypothetical protein [Marixanthomonas ophiurae]RFN58545.1 hypothetical protein DZ858_00210 [Marixanthomonas ophiurae]
MKLYSKIILTIPVVIGLIYTLTFFSVDFFLWISKNIAPFEYQTLTVGIIIYPPMIYIIYRLWSFKNIEKEIKWNWTFLLILFTIVTMPMYIWKKDDELFKENKHNTIT